MAQTDEEFLATIPDRDEADEVFLANIPDKREMSNEEAYSRLMYPMPTAEQESLEEDFIPPIVLGMAAAPLIGGSIGLGVTAGGVAGRTALGVTQATTMAIAEGTIIKPGEEIAGEIHPWLKPIFGIVAGMGSAVTIEALGNEMLLKLLTKTAPKFWSNQLGLAQQAGLLDKQFLDRVDDIIKNSDMGNTEAAQKLLNEIRKEVHGEVLSKAGKKLNKMRMEKPVAELPATDKVLKDISRKNILDDYDYQKLAQVAERDAINEYTTEFNKVKKGIIDEYWKVEKDLVNPKTARSSIEYKYRDEFDRIFRDEILLRTQEKESDYLAKVLGVKPYDRDEVFDKLAGLQRGDPEFAMLRATRKMGGGVMQQTLEHAGDIIHRMSQTPWHGKGYYELVKSKVNLVYRRLHSGYGFEKEFNENIIDNAGDMGIDAVKLRKEVDNLLLKHAKEHGKLPAYNEMHKASNDLNKALGKQKWDDARKAIDILKKNIDKGEEHWEKVALEYTPGSGLKPGASNAKAVMNTMSELSSLENVVKEVISLRNVTRRISNIIRKQTTQEMTVANKSKIERLRNTYNQRMLEYKTALKIKNDTAIIQKRLSSFLGGHKEMTAEAREQIQNFLAPMFGKPTKKLNETMFKFLQRKYNDELSIASDVLVKRYDKMLQSITSRTRPFEEFTFKQIKDIDDFTKAFQFMSRNEKIINYQSIQRYTADVANEIAASARKGMSKYSAFQPRVTGKQLEELSKKNKGAIGRYTESIVDFKDGFFAVLKRMEPIVRQLDGFEDFGTAWKHIFNKAAQAEIAKEQLGQAVFSKWQKIFGDHRIAAAMGKRPGKYWTATSGNLAGYNIDKETAIVMALHSGNKDNMEALLKGLGIEESVLTKFLKTALNDADRKFVNDAWDMIDELFPIMARTYKEMTGLTLQKIKNGRYYPIHADPKYSNVEKSFQDLFKAEVNPKMFKAEIEKGFTKARVGGVNAVKLSLRNLTQHLEDVVHMSTHWKPINEIQRLTRHPDFRAGVNETLGTKIYDQFDPWLKNLAKPNRTEYAQIWSEKSLGKLRRNVTTVALGYVPKVGVKQTLSLITALPEVGHRNMLASIIKCASNPRRFINAVKEASPEMMFRQKTWQRDIAEMAAKYDHKGALKGGAAMLRFKFIHMFDNITASTTWYGAYLKGLDNYAGDANRAVNFANILTRKTQPASAAKDLPLIMRSGEAGRSITMFYSYYSVYHNQAMEIVQRGLAGNMSVPKVLWTLAYLAIAPAMAWYGATKVWNHATGRPEEEFDGWEFAKAVGTSTMSGIPMARDIASAGIMGYDYRLSPIEDVGTELVDSFKALGKIAQEDKEFNKQDFISSMELAGYLFNLPTRQAITTVLGAQRLMSGESDDWTEVLDRPKYKKE